MTVLSGHCCTCNKPVRRRVSAARAVERTGQELFCSQGCRKLGQTLVCSVCGNSFYLKRDQAQRPGRDGMGHWCSRACADIGRKRGETRNCKTCGNPFYVYPSAQKKEGIGGHSSRANAYCSVKCTPLDEIRHRKGKNLGARRTPEQRERMSEHMRGILKKPMVTWICVHCGIILQLTAAQASHKSKFCTKTCWYEHIREHPEAHPTYKGGKDPYYGPNWHHQAKLARERDNHTCQRCGLQQMQPRLSVHHRRPRREFERGEWIAMNALPNLITLCNPCHMTAEATGEFALAT